MQTFYPRLEEKRPKSPKELYAEFLKSEFWQKLTRKKIWQVKRCEQCRGKKNLQSHHIRYPQDWYDTTLDDLKVLCQRCHSRFHGYARAPKKRNHKFVSAKKYARVRAKIRHINRTMFRQPYTPPKPNWVDYGRIQQQRFKAISPLSEGNAVAVSPTEKEDLSRDTNYGARQTNLDRLTPVLKEGVDRDNPAHFTASNPATAALQH